MAMFTVSSFRTPTHDAEIDTFLIRLCQMHKNVLVFFTMIAA